MSSFALPRWAEVAQMGHVSYVGFVSEVALAGAPMLHVRLPAVPGDDGREDLPEEEVLVHPQSLYRLVPLTEAEALASRRAKRPYRPTSAPRALPLADEVGDDEDYVDQWGHGSAGGADAPSAVPAGGDCEDLPAEPASGDVRPAELALLADALEVHPDTDTEDLREVLGAARVLAERLNVDDGDGKPCPVCGDVESHFDDCELSALVNALDHVAPAHPPQVVAGPDGTPRTEGEPL